MVKTRLMPCLLLKDGLLVRSERFTVHQIIGNPIHEVARFNQWLVDELIYLDISAERGDNLAPRGVPDAEGGRPERAEMPSRADVKVSGGGSALDILDAVARTCFMPLTFGGRIRTVEDIRVRIQRGADKVTVNTAAIERPGFITEAAQIFGSQCIVVSIDVKRHANATYEVFSHRGARPTGWDPVAWAKTIERLGAGEIFLNAIDRDGTAEGYDLPLIRAVADATAIPVIACGGVGTYEHFAAGITEGHASAVSAANIFHFKELSDRQAKRVMRAAGLDVRLSAREHRHVDAAHSVT